MKKYTYTFLILLVLIFLTTPYLVSTFAPTADTLDTSWAWFLGYAFSHGLQWGKAVIFNYGPLGFLDHVYFYNNYHLWLLSAFTNILVRVFFGLLLMYFTYYYVLKNSNDQEDFGSLILLSVVLSILVSSTLTPSELLPLMTTIILVNIFNDNTSNTIDVKILLASISSGVILALGSLIKLNILPFSVSVFVIFPILIFYTFKSQKYFFLSLVGFMSFFISFLVFYALSKQNIDNLWLFVKGSYEIIKGYTPTMFIHGNHFQTFMAFTTLLYFIFVALKAFKNKQKTIFSQFVLLLLFLFIAYKEGFTRHDPGLIGGHALFFFSVSLILTTFAMLIFTKHNLSKKYLSLIFILTFCFNAIGGSINLTSLAAQENFVKVLINYKNARTNLQKTSNELIRNQFNINQSIVNATKASSVTIIPWNLMMIQGYHMKFVPQPIFQAYQANTPYLDKQNANQLLSKKAPKKIIYTFEDIDGRYPPFSEPYTFQAILSCYNTEIPGNTYSLFNRKEQCNKLELIEILYAKAHLNQWISVPKNADFMNVYIKTSLLSHVMNVLYKPFGQISIYFKLSNGSIVGPYRFIYTVSKDYLFIKYYLADQSDINQLLKGDAYGLLKIKAFKLKASKINLDYSSSYKVFFYSANLNFKEINDLTPLNQTTLYTIESISLNKSSNENSLQISGWAVDSIAKNEDSGVIAVVDNKYFYLLRSGLKRLDVSATFNNPNYEYSGFMGNVPVNNLTPGTHTLILWIINNQSTGYFESKPIKLIITNKKR